MSRIMQIQGMLSTEVKALFPSKYTIGQPHFHENILLDQLHITNII